MLGLERRIWLFLIVGIIFSPPVFIKAQSQSDTTTITLQEVALQAPKTETVQNKLPFSLSTNFLFKSIWGLYQAYLLKMQIIMHKI